MRKLLLLSLSLLCFSAIAQQKIEHHKHFVIKEWEGFRESGDTLIYISPKIIRGSKGPRAEAFFIKHPEIVKYLKKQELLLFLDFAQIGWPCRQVETLHSKKKNTYSTINFKNNICIFYINPL